MPSHMVLSYLQGECIENAKLSYVQNIILTSQPDKVIDCRKLRWICRKNSDDVAGQVKTPRGQVRQHFCRAT